MFMPKWLKEKGGKNGTYFKIWSHWGRVFCWWTQNTSLLTWNNFLFILQTLFLSDLYWWLSQDTLTMNQDELVSIVLFCTSDWKMRGKWGHVKAEERIIFLYHLWHPLYPWYFPLANRFVTSPSSEGCGGLWGSAGLLLPTSQRFQSAYKEARLKQY